MRVRSGGSAGSVTQRAERSGPRLVIGVGLVAAAAVVAFTTGTGDEGFSALVATRPVAQGTALDGGAVRQVIVDVPDPTVLHPPQLSDGAIAGRSLTPGEPVLVHDVVGRRPDDRRITLPIAPAAMPVDLGVGEHVDVWQAGRSSTPLITDAVVAGVTPPDLGEARVEVVVGPADVATAVAATTTPDIVLARLP